MDTPNAPVNMDDFKAKAASFVQKAKAAGKSNTAISNTLKFMYTLTQQNIQNQPSQLENEQMQLEKDKFEWQKQQAEKTNKETEVIKDAAGNPILIDKKTGAVIKNYTPGGADADLMALETGTGSSGTSGATEANAPSIKSLDSLYQDLGVEAPSQAASADTQSLYKSSVTKPKNDLNSLWLDTTGKFNGSIPLNMDKLQGNTSGLYLAAPNSPFEGLTF